MTDAASPTNASPSPAAVTAMVLVGMALAGCIGTLPHSGVPVTPDGSDGVTGNATPDDDLRPDLGLAVRVLGPTIAEVAFRPPSDGSNRTVVVTYAPTELRGYAGVVKHPVTGGRLILGDLAPNQTYEIHARVPATGLATPATATSHVTTPPRSWSSPEDALVQPGVLIDIGSTGCTLGFVVTSAVNASVYGLSAGHCFDEVGDAVRVDGAGGPFVGRVAFFEDHSQYIDWGLVRIDADKLNRTSPAVRGLGGPSDVADVSGYDRTDRLCMRGSSAFSLPRTWMGSHWDRRCGTFASYIPSNASWDVCDPADRNCKAFGMPEGLNWYTWYGPAAWGDSGAPVVDAEAGEAVGILTRFNVGAGVRAHADGTTLGPTLASILDRAAERGWHLRLATADDQNPVGVTG